MQSTPLSCWECGTVLSTTGGRCPACGAEQPSPAPAVDPAMPVAPLVRPQQERPPPDPGRRRRAAAPWVLLSVGLAAIGALAAMLGPHRHADGGDRPAPAPSVAPPRPEHPVDPNDLGITDPSAVKPADLLGRARTRALAWSTDALLLSFRATPVLDGRVNLSNGGTVEYTFGKPTGEGFGAGARVSGKRLRISLGQGGTKLEETNTGLARAALEPNCPLEDAVRKAVAAGVPSNSSLAVSYQFDERRNKTVWRITPTSDESLTRMVDGWTCAVLVR